MDINIGSNSRASIYLRQNGASISVGETRLAFPSTVATKNVSITSDIDWSILSCPEWLRVTPSQGKAGEATLAVESTDNPNTTSRTGVIQIGRGGFTGNKQIRVTQEGKRFSDLGETLEFPNTASSQTLGISTDGTWTAKADAPWITLSPSTGNGDADITVSVTSNPDEDSRQGNVLVSVGETTRQVAVNQQGRFIRITCDDVLTASTPATVKVSIAANVDWTAATNATWMSVSPSSGTGNAELTVSISDNPSVNERKGEVTFSTADGSKVLTFSQPGKSLTLNCTDLTFNAKGGQQDVTVTTDGTFAVASSTSWITTSTKDNLVTINVGENTTSSKREGSVSFSLTGLKDGESLTRTIKITQHPKLVNIGRGGYDEDEDWNL